MTEKELRQSYVNAAVSYLGCKESDGSHKKIIDLYNSHKPLAPATLFFTTGTTTESATIPAGPSMSALS